MNSDNDCFLDYTNYKDLTPTQETECFENLDKENRERIITSHLKLVLKICDRYRFLKSSLYTDLVQDGVIGLIEAIDHFDPARGNRFSTYARYRINGKTRSFLRKMSFNHHVPERKAWEFSKILKNIPENDILTLNPVDRVKELLKCSDRYAQNTLKALNGIKTPKQECSLPNDAEEDEMIEIINFETSILPLNEKRLLEMRHEEGLSWREIGEKLDMSHEGVRKKHKRIIFKIKGAI